MTLKTNFIYAMNKLNETQYKHDDSLMAFVKESLTNGTLMKFAELIIFDDRMYMEGDGCSKVEVPEDNGGDKGKSRKKRETGQPNGKGKPVGTSKDNVTNAEPESAKLASKINIL